MGKPYQYEGLEAELYDTLDELSDFEDSHFYHWFATACPGPVLDLGCGTGRILRDLASGGLEVVGLDSSPDMLRQARSAAKQKVELVQGDMRDFDLGEGRFGTILIAGFSIQLLLAETDLDACLRCCKRHLREGGQLILTTFMPWEMIWDGRDEAPLELRRQAKLDSGKITVRAFQGWKLEKQKQYLHLMNRYEISDRRTGREDVEEKEMTVRWHMPHDLQKKLSEMGFGDISLYGDFEFAPAQEDSESIIYLARS